MAPPRLLPNLVGRRFGRLVVTEHPPGRHAVAVCDCGATKRVWAWPLVKGTIRSCGCLARETKAGNQWNLKHGHAGNWRTGRKASPEYNSWNAMMARCYLPNHTKYATYGAVGVGVAERWHDFDVFLAEILAAIGPRPKGTTLDRWPNPAGNYEPGNVRWATLLEQRHNRRRS